MICQEQLDDDLVPNWQQPIILKKQQQKNDPLSLTYICPY